MILMNRHNSIKNPTIGFFENIYPETNDILTPQSLLVPSLMETYHPHPELPKVDISETDETYLLRVELPGFEKKNLDVKYENDTLTIRGSKENELKNMKMIYQERQYGNFVRHFSLPRNVDASKLQAFFKDGLLTITVPKPEVAKVREVQIEK